MDPCSLVMSHLAALSPDVRRDLHRSAACCWGGYVQTKSSEAQKRLTRADKAQYNQLCDSELNQPAVAVRPLSPCH